MTSTTSNLFFASLALTCFAPLAKFAAGSGFNTQPFAVFRDLLAAFHNILVSTASRLQRDSLSIATTVFDDVKPPSML